MNFRIGIAKCQLGPVAQAIIAGRWGDLFRGPASSIEFQYEKC